MQQKNSQENDQYVKEFIKNNYLEVLGTLGYGTFGRVKLVKFDKHPEVYALKIMRKREILEQNQLMHIHSERQVLIQIKHPNIVSLKTTFQDYKHIYMLFEYIQGGELFSRLTKNGRFANDVTLFYVTGILDAICYLHAKCIVFRDLKPQNILIDSEGYPMLIDLGFAKVLKAKYNYRTNTICGTPQYLAPEMLDKNNLHGYGKEVDYWGIGILIYELLTGYPPFSDNADPQNIYKKIIKGVFELPEFFSLRAKDLVLKLPHPDPQKRLGAKDSGESIRKHAWFQKVNWKMLKQAKVPWKPEIKNIEDFSHFDQVPASKGTTVSIAERHQNLFNGF